MAIDGGQLREILGRIDAHLARPGSVCLIGSGASMLMGQPARQTDDLDMWAKASRIALADLQEAVEAAGLAFDPKEELPRVPYLQVVQPGIVQVPGWDPSKREWFGEPEREPWRGKNLTVTVPPPQALVASKMIRGYDRDFEDAIWLMAAHNVDTKIVARAVQALPTSVRSKARNNLAILSLLGKRLG